MFEWSELILSKVVYFQVIIFTLVLLPQQIIAQLPWNYLFLLLHFLYLSDDAAYSRTHALYRVFFTRLGVLDVQFFKYLV